MGLFFLNGAKEIWTTFEHTLKSGEIAEQTSWAAIELASGLIVPATGGAGQYLIGTFTQRLVGDGTKKARIQLFRRIVLARAKNDPSPNDVAPSDIGSICYLAGDRQVSMSSLSGTRPPAGRVWWVKPPAGDVLFEPSVD